MCFKKETLIKILPPIIGFGIGGALWGIILYLWRPIDYPLNFIALVMILFGGIGLGWDLKSIKKNFKSNWIWNHWGNSRVNCSIFWDLSFTNYRFIYSFFIPQLVN